MTKYNGEWQTFREDIIFVHITIELMMLIRTDFNVDKRVKMKENILLYCVK